jgi:hypothetical protein
MVALSLIAMVYPLFSATMRSLIKFLYLVCVRNDLPPLMAIVYTPRLLANIWVESWREYNPDFDILLDDVHTSHLIVTYKDFDGWTQINVFPDRYELIKVDVISGLYDSSDTLFAAVVATAPSPSEAVDSGHVAEGIPLITKNPSSVPLSVPQR